jgi:hypothetical protein
MRVGATSTTTTSQHEGWSIININTSLEIFNSKLESHQHQHEAGNIQHEASIINNISMKLKYSTLGLASQQHQHEARNIQH